MFTLQQKFLYILTVKYWSNWKPISVLESSHCEESKTNPTCLNNLTPGPLDSWASSLLLYFLILPLTSSYLFLLLSSFGMVWYGGRGVEFLHWRLRWTIGDWLLTFILMLKSYGWWVVGVLIIITSALVLFWVMRWRLEMDQDPSLTSEFQDSFLIFNFRILFCFLVCHQTFHWGFWWVSILLLKKK